MAVQDETANGEPPQKRRRISLACSACRARKSRCDGVRPRCTACTELNFDCVYQQSPSSSNVIVGKEYLTSIEDRLKVVEEALALRSTTQQTSSRRVRFDPNDGHAVDETNGTATPTTNRETGHDGTEVDRSGIHDVTLEDETDGMGAIIFSAEDESAFFGSSSNIAFTRHISHAVAQISQYRHNTQPHTIDATSHQILDSGLVSATRPSSPNGTRIMNGLHENASNHGPVNVYALPSENKTRELITRYFSETGLLFPYIHEGTFMETYNQLRGSNFRKVRRSWLGLLNMIMAMATSISISSVRSAAQRANESDVYYQRARGLCDNQIMRGTSLEIVQCLLVMGHYLQGTQRSVEAWTIHGLAVKAALQLGLHSPESSARFSPLIQEFRKRTFYACVILDRTMSMTFGRPAAIPDGYVRLELPYHIDAETPSSGAIGDRRRELSVDFFKATITLYKIMWSVIDLSYGGNLGISGHSNVLENVSRLFQLQAQMADWETLLPEGLNLRNHDDIPEFSDADTVKSTLERFRTILTLRHHNLLILLHRPFLVNFLDIAGTGGVETAAKDVTLLRQVGSNSVQICIQAAMDIIAIVKSLVTATDQRRTWLGAWWFTLYYVFNAALVIFASILVTQVAVNGGVQGATTIFSCEEMQRSLHEAAVTLRHLDFENRTVEKCAQYLKKLFGLLEALGIPKLSMPSSTPGLTNDLSSDQIQAYNTMYSALNSNDILRGFPMDMISNTSPLGMDLGEFMVEDDFAFLNQLSNMAAESVL